MCAVHSLLSTLYSQPSTRVSHVAGLRHQHLLHQPAAAEEPRPYRAYRNTKDRRRGFVGLVLDVHEHQRRLERLGQLGESALDRWPEVEPRVEIVARVVRRFPNGCAIRKRITLTVAEVDGR